MVLKIQDSYMLLPWQKTLTPPLLQIDMREEIDMQTKCAES